MERKQVAAVCLVLSLVLGSVACLLVFHPESSVEQFVPGNRAVAQQNGNCLKCHASRHYEMVKPTNKSKVIHGRMPREYFIDTVKYLASSHWDFRCTDCHSSGYETVPHDPDARFESMPTCLDCHDPDADTAWAKFKFKTIERDFDKSVHHDREWFTCWTCHDPHSTTMCARNDSMPLAQVVETSNAMCVKCHSLDKIYDEHEIFPHTDVHLQKNRCIDCHVAGNDSVLVPHNVMSREFATRNCATCHSKNSSVVRDFISKRKDPSGVKENNLAGYYDNKILTIALVVVLSAIVVFISGFIVWSLTRRRYEN